MLGYTWFVNWFARVDDAPPIARVLLYHPPTDSVVQLGRYIEGEREGQFCRLTDPVVRAWTTRADRGKIVRTNTAIKLPSADLIPLTESEAAEHAQQPAAQPQPARATAAFTLVELLVVVGIIAIILTVVAPAITRLVQSANVEAARSSIPAAVATARAYAPLGGSFPIGEYKGSAAIVMPWGELRIARHSYNARDESGNPYPPELMGFTDVPDEPYVSLPDTVGVVGLSRLDDGDPMLMPPPFAIRFTSEGTMASYHYTPGGPFDDEGRVVFYGQNDSPRPADYDPADFDPDVVGRTATNWDDAAEEWIAPFGMLESVIAVVVYNKPEFRSAGHSLEGGTTGVSDDARDWIMEHGKPLFFNQYSGSGIKP